MWDGTTKTISSINVGDTILGCDENTGNLIPSKVLNVYQNGLTNSWVKIKRKLINQQIVCTPNHEIYTKNRGYISAKELVADDVLLYTEYGYVLSDTIKSILIGKILGDGHLFHHQTNMRISFGHKVSHEEYVDYLLYLLGELTNSTKHYRTSGYGSKMVTSSTKNLIGITKEFKHWIVDGKKIIPNDIKLDKYSLAFWYMDDGSRSHSDSQRDRALFAVCAYSDIECEHLVNALNNFGFSSPKLFKDSNGYNRIRLNLDDANLLFDTIKDIIPDCMQYKLPVEYRGFFVSPTPYQPIKTRTTIDVFVDSVEYISSTDYPNKNCKYPNNKKYDIETETSNYFVSKSLVHNSNGSIMKTVAGELKFASHNCFWEDVPENNCIYTKIYHQNTHLGLIPKNCQFFYEIYGSGVQDLTYGLSGIDYAAFAVAIDGKFLDYPDFQMFCSAYNIKTAPLLYVGNYSYDMVQSFNNKNSIICPSQMMEGVIVQPLKERYSSHFGRVCMKFISDKYLLRKNGSEFK
jgi:hypothetical protein